MNYVNTNCNLHPLLYGQKSRLHSTSKFHYYHFPKAEKFCFLIKLKKIYEK